MCASAANGYRLCGRRCTTENHRQSQELETTSVRHRVFIGSSILSRPWPPCVSAIVGFGLATMIAAGVYGCHHPEPSSSTPHNPIAGRWQAEIASPVGLQQCVMEVGDMGQIAYGDSCPMPLTGQQATVTTVPNGAYAPNLFVTGKDSGTFMIVGGVGIAGMVGAFRIEGDKHLETRIAPGADIEWTRSSKAPLRSASASQVLPGQVQKPEAPMGSAAAGQVLPGQVQWPVSGVPAIAQHATAYVRSKWQPDAFLTSIQMELNGGIANAQSPSGGLLIQFTFYSPGQQQTLAYMPNSPAGELIPGSSADPNDERAMPANFMDLPDAVAKLRTKGMRGKQIKTVHIENYGRGSYAGSFGVFGPEWVIDSALDEHGAVLAELPDRGGDVRISTPESEAGADENQQGSNIHVDIGGLRNNRGQVYCWLFTSAQDFPSNGRGNAESTASTITDRHAACDFENRDSGSYAIVVFHDEDSQHVIELNPDGTAREGVGFSNNPSISSAMPGYDAAMFAYRTGELNLTINIQYPNSANAPANAVVPRTLTGFAFVDGSVTGQGSHAKLPSGTKIYPPGSTITGTDGCPTTRCHTDGMIVAVIDYQGRPTAGKVAVTRHPARGGQFDNAPYYLDLDPGRTLQLLGPIFENGTYDVHLEYDYSLGEPKTDSATFVLARGCSY